MTEYPYHYNVLVTEHDGFNTRSFVLPLKTKDAINLDELRRRVMAACDEYVRTPEGKRTYSYNCGCFNWADFESDVPDEICRKHGFTKNTVGEINYEVDWDEHLVTDTETDE